VAKKSSMLMSSSYKLGWKVVLILWCIYAMLKLNVTLNSVVKPLNESFTLPSIILIITNTITENNDSALG
jgi:hypothetical protein